MNTKILLVSERRAMLHHSTPRTSRKHTANLEGKKAEQCWRGAGRQDLKVAGGREMAQQAAWGWGRNSVYVGYHVTMTSNSFRTVCYVKTHQVVQFKRVQLVCQLALNKSAWT